MVKLKKELLDTEIYIPFTKQTMLGRFIPEDLYPAMGKKFPELFETYKEEQPKSKKVNDLHIKDTITPNLYDSEAKQG